MAAGAAVDDKRADERRIKELRDFQRSNPTNKRCFDCNEMMPQYVCVDFNTFVCTSCSGIHREFGHRVKSISMSKFTDTEVKNMLKFGGNEAAQKIWRAKHDANFRPSGGTDGERTRNFIRLTYIDKKWQYESPRVGSRDDQPQSRTASNGAKKATTSGGDDFFASPSSSSKATPSFDAFSDPSSQSSNNSGFATFGDFSSFEKPKKQHNDFDDFGRFESPTSTSSQSTSGFGDFGSFASKPSAAPPLRDEFKTGSFTLAPPPGTDFGAFGAPAVAAPLAQPKLASGGNDFLAFSPQNSKPATNDPFGFANSPMATTKTNSQKAGIPFDGFGSPSGATTNRSSFDAFGAPASTGSRSASSSFDAFGPAASSTTAASFDAFGAAAPSSPANSGFNAFGAAAPPAAPASPGFGAFDAPTPAFNAFGSPVTTAKTSSGSLGGFGANGIQAGASSAAFDAFGAPSPAGSAFDGFGTNTSSSRTNSATPSDPFSGFSPRNASGSKALEPPKAAAADPFAAFDDVESSTSLSAPAPAPSGPVGSAYDAFGSVQSAPNQNMGQAPSPFGQVTQMQTQSASIADPFAFTGATAKAGSFSSGGLGGPTKTGSFPSSAPGSQSGLGSPEGFGGFQSTQSNPFGQASAQPHGFPPQQHIPQQQQQMYQQQTGQFGQYPAQRYAGQPGMQPQQHQWMHPNAGGFAGQAPPQQSHPSQITLGHQSNAAQTPSVSQAAAPKADVAALKDPFASLNLGNLGASAPKSNPSSRGSSFAKPAGSPATSATSSFTNSTAPPGNAAPMVGSNAAFAMGSASLSSGGGASRGNSFDMAPSHFGTASASSNASSMASFSTPAMGTSSSGAFGAPSSTPAFGTPSPSPIDPFAFPGGQNTAQKQNSFGGMNAFDAFGSPARTDSMKQSAPPAAPSNPFDMF